MEGLGQHAVGFAIAVSFAGATAWIFAARSVVGERPRKGLVAASAVVCFGAVLTRIVHDCNAYVQQRSLANRLDNPWGEGSENGYCPLFNLLASPAAANIFIPKLLFVATLTAFLSSYVARTSRTTEPVGQDLQRWALLAVYPSLWESWSCRGEAALSHAIRRLLDNPGDASRLGRAGQDHVRSRFDLAVMAGNYGFHYRELLHIPT